MFLFTRFRTSSSTKIAAAFSSGTTATILLGLLKFAKKNTLKPNVLFFETTTKINALFERAGEKPNMYQNEGTYTFNIQTLLRVRSGFLMLVCSASYTPTPEKIEGVKMDVRIRALDKPKKNRLTLTYQIRKKLKTCRVRKRNQKQKNKTNNKSKSPNTTSSVWCVCVGRSSRTKENFILVDYA